MATKITMPRLSDTMTEGTVATWLKKVGDKISEGDILAEIETDKATMEFESFNSGTLLYIGIPEGETAPVDSLLAIIGNEGEDISGLISGGSETVKTEEAAVAPSAAPEAKTETAALPKGVVVVTMPRLSDTMTEGTVATWLKKVGDKVSEGDILAEIETDKATMEFESFNAGTLLFIGINEGQTAPVDSVLAIIGPEGTDITGIAENYKKGGAAPSAPTESKAEAPTQTISTPISTTESTSGRVFASPLAKKIAEEKGINLSQVKGQVKMEES
jgi:pyruvate dehydrogenase E2 component (dihydrolipoamide acetyltransferase)